VVERVLKAIIALLGNYNGLASKLLEWLPAWCIRVLYRKQERWYMIRCIGVYRWYMIVSNAFLLSLCTFHTGREERRDTL
jgi:hypothetical protein